MFFALSGESSEVTVKGPPSGKHTRSSSVSSLEGAFLSQLCTPETVKKKKGFFERLSKSVVRQSKSGKSTARKTFHSPRVVPGSPLRAPTVTPPMVPVRPPSPFSAAVPPPVLAAMAAKENVTVADLTRELKQAFEEISLGVNYPMPTFNGKKGENPEDHCMKAEDYFKVYKIVRDEDKRRCFTDTLFLTARRWAEQLPDTVTNFDFDPDNEDSKKISIKYQFLQRFVVKGRTTEAMYTAKVQKFKPVITPPRRRGSNFCGGGSFGNKGQGAQNIRDNRINQNNGTYWPRGQNFPNRGNKRYGMSQNRNFRPNGRFGGRGRFDNSPNVRCPRVASSTVDKDKGRCYYCKEIGHFVSKCTKKIEDERGQARYNSMGQGISQFEDWEV